MIALCFTFLLLFTTCTATPVPAFNNVATMSEPFPNSNFMLNIQELADLAMDRPKLTNQSLLQLYQQATDIINGTDADRVLYSLDPLRPINETIVDSKPILVMAVYNPASPSGAELLEQFKIYYVNVSQTTPFAMLKSDLKELVAQKKHNTWATIRNFFKNQVNAVVGAFMLPYKVSAHAMHQVSSEHAQYVHTGTTFGHAIAKPILMKSFALPNDIAHQVVNMTVGYVNAVEASEYNSKQVAGQTIDTAANHVADAAQATSQVVVQYAVRPIGAFAGYHLSQAGKSLANFGSHLDGAGNRVSGLGQQLGQSALVAVDTGVTAIQWSLDNSTVLPGEQHNGTEAMHAST